MAVRCHLIAVCCFKFVSRNKEVDFDFYILRLKRLDELIKYRQTGCMRELADKMSLSERHTYRCINSLKQLGAPVEFSHFHNSYHYVDSGELKLEWEKPKNETNEK